MLLAMGFPEPKCAKALRKCGMNTERATEWLLSNMDAPSDDEEAKTTDEPASKVNDQYRCSKPGVYELQSFITHLGSSVHAGHYVCHVKKPAEEGEYKVNAEEEGEGENIEKKDEQQ